MLARLIGEHITTEYEFCENLPCTEVDVCNLEQVILNLAVNARDAMPKGGKLKIATSLVQIAPPAVCSHPGGRPGDFVCLSITDTGCGMDDRTKSRLFEPFFTTKEIGKGTGMGLATAYGLIKQHQGWIEVESQVGLGSTFKIFLPANKKRLKTRSKAASPAHSVGGNETILVVEDEEPVRDFLSGLLREYGYNVRQAADGAEALNIWRHATDEIDLVLKDLVMPRLSGIDLADTLWKDDRNLKVIFTSGYSPDPLNEHFRSRPDMKFLPKPYSPEKLAELVRNCLDK